MSLLKEAVSNKQILPIYKEEDLEWIGCSFGQEKLDINQIEVLYQMCIHKWKGVDHEIDNEIVNIALCCEAAEEGRFFSMLTRKEEVKDYYAAKQEGN